MAESWSSSDACQYGMHAYLVQNYNIVYADCMHTCSTSSVYCVDSQKQGRGK